MTLHAKIIPDVVAGAIIVPMTTPVDGRRVMRKFNWKRIYRSWLGRSLVGALIGALVVVFANIDDTRWVLVGMVTGALLLFLLGGEAE